MFTVGDFARLAQVSKRLLRYYDEIGLLKPNHIDRLTGYRYYSAEQLPTLNRILALKELGLSLDQIQRMVSDQVSPDDIQGMLLLRKAEIEQQMQEEIQRIRNIESRLQSIRSAESDAPLDVVIKRMPAQPVLSVRITGDLAETALGLYGYMMSALPAKSIYGPFFGIWYSGSLYESDIDIEMGRFIQVTTHDPIALQGDFQLTFRELPAMEAMATFVVKGPPENMHIGYSAIGTWTEVNGYRFGGPPREVAVQPPQIFNGSDGITEIQFPIELISSAL
jgi:DNA-binding transcriptional MerR regulator